MVRHGFPAAHCQGRGDRTGYTVPFVVRPNWGLDAAFHRPGLTRRVNGRQLEWPDAACFRSPGDRRGGRGRERMRERPGRASWVLKRLAWVVQRAVGCAVE